MKPTVFLLFASWVLYGLGASASEDYTAYHQRIGEAEELIARAEFAQALAIYDQLFADYAFVFRRDCQVAAQLALYTGHSQQVLRYLRRGVAQGWELKSIRKNTYLKQHLEPGTWQLLSAEYDSLRALYERRINVDMRTQVHSMFKKDQWKALGALLRFSAKARDRYAERKFAPHSEKQLAQLIPLILNGGYPGERLIGNSSWAAVILSHHNSISDAYVQQDSLYKYLQPSLRQALRQGYLSPYEYGSIDNWYRVVVSGHQTKAYGILEAGMTPAEVQEANRLRAEIGLRSIQTHNQLLQVQRQTGMDFYLPSHFGTSGEIKVDG
ncbi:hypothetical protein GCM10027275_14590 [Rhabdobacter roseus]|uniref:DUF4034 domain-containing protein n=1 Tax=Rhabdobacter roseus TaxID=1655419 RepID=A0A840TUM1_9BACT|nr:hypothetical protein [Rhabdobacter roseus]MBB5283379.1 hypothetical protein [Rhabdobacter roseus]